MGEENSKFLGLLLIQGYFHAFNRPTLHEGNNLDDFFFCTLTSFKNFATPDFVTIL